MGECRRDAGGCNENCTAERCHTSAGGPDTSALQITFDYAAPTDAGGSLMVATTGRTLKETHSREGSSTNKELDGPPEHCSLVVTMA